MMKNTRMIFALMATLICCAFFPACEMREQMPWDEVDCPDGVNVRFVNDSAIPQHLKEMVYTPPIGYRRVGAASAKLVIIPFEFKDEWPHNTAVTESLIREHFFAPGTGSVRDYFMENSWGQFSLEEGVIAPVVTLKHNPSHYGEGQKNGDWTRSPALHQELCERAVVNWRVFDTDGDGIVRNEEVQVCFMSSKGELGAKRMSSPKVSTHFGNIEIAKQHFVFFDCKRNDDPNKAEAAIAYNLPTIWHELCHGLFDVPDRYDRYCGSGATGQYDIMSDNCGRLHMNIFDKMKLGWIRPHIISSVGVRPDNQRTCFTFPAIERLPAALVFYNELSPYEYWIIENRHKEASRFGFDDDLPESGLAVWWVDATTNNVHLVDAGQPSKRPQDYVYSAGQPYTGALFQAESCIQGDVGEVLVGQDALPRFMIKGVSTVGRTMSCEL
jgi:M6 family metalloprotease-like protein